MLLSWLLRLKIQRSLGEPKVYNSTSTISKYSITKACAITTLIPCPKGRVGNTEAVTIEQSEKWTAENV